MNSEDDDVRVNGPSLWLEFSLQSNKSTGEEGNHRILSGVISTTITAETNPWQP